MFAQITDFSTITFVTTRASKAQKNGIIIDVLRRFMSESKVPGVRVARRSVTGAPGYFSV